MLKSLCVFCGSRPGRDPMYAQVAQELGMILAQKKIRLVYGGGRVGMMGTIADSVLSAGGEVVGVIPEALVHREVAHAGLTELHVVQTMHQRKALMSELSDGFLSLPGGIGTFEELFEILTWGQLGFHTKPIAILNTAGYYDPLIHLLDRSIEDGFLLENSKSLYGVLKTPQSLFEFFEQYYTQTT